MCCGSQTSSGSSNNSGSSTVDPDLKNAALDWYKNQQRIQNAGQNAALGSDGKLKPYQEYTDPRIAGMTDAQRQAILDQMTHGNDSRQVLQQGRDVATAAAGYQPTNAVANGYTASGYDANGYDANGYEANGYKANLQGQAAQTGGAATIAGSNLDRYINPFRSEVTDRTLADLDRARKMALNDGGSSAAAANAFGGSRHGVADSLTNDSFARASASALAGLNKDAFTTALGAAGQDTTQINDVNKFDTSNRQQVQNLNQSASNTADQFDAAAKNTAMSESAAAKNAAAAFTAGAKNTSGAFNAGAKNTSGAFNAGAANDAASQSADAKNKTSMFNSTLGLQGAQLRGSMASVLNALGNSLQANTNSNNQSLMDLGAVDQGTQQKQLDFNYLNNYLNPNYNDPQFKMGLLNSSQGNAPALASNSTQSGGSSSCGC